MAINTVTSLVIGAKLEPKLYDVFQVITGEKTLASDFPVFFASSFRRRLLSAAATIWDIVGSCNVYRSQDTEMQGAILVTLFIPLTYVINVIIDLIS